MKMVDLSGRRSPLQIITTPTTVDCAKDIRFRRSFRSIVECMVPCCCGFQPPEGYNLNPIHTSSVTATFFGFRRGRVSFCLQDSSHASPLLLLEFAIPTAYLAREMRHGLLRIALESTDRPGSGTIFGVPVWTMYCNGKKVGFAVRREMSEADTRIFKLMQLVSVGAGVLPGESKVGEGDLMYMRAKFERVTGSVNSESFHMINPAGSIGQELSIFLLRS